MQLAVVVRRHQNCSHLVVSCGKHAATLTLSLPQESSQFQGGVGNRALFIMT